MIDFAWREDLSESFGRIKRPVAEIFVKDPNKKWRALTMLVDSGADATVINRTIAELFGHNLTRGRKIKMKGFGNQAVSAYVHTMEFKIGDTEIKSRVAVADMDDTPNVLGRKDIFDLFEIQFKNIEQCTRFIRRTS